MVSKIAGVSFWFPFKTTKQGYFIEIKYKTTRPAYYWLPSEICLNRLDRCFGRCSLTASGSSTSSSSYPISSSSALSSAAPAIRIRRTAYCGGTKSISHHLRNHGNHCLLAFTGESSFQKLSLSLSLCRCVQRVLTQGNEQGHQQPSRT